MFQNSVLPTTADIPHSFPHAGLTSTLRRMVRDVPLPQTARAYLVWMLVMVFVACLVTLQIWISLKITEAERKVAELTGVYTQIEQENAELLWQISQFTHLERIKTEATRMGYGPSLEREYQWAEPNFRLATPMSPAQHTEMASQPAHMESTDPRPVGELPWYRAYWQEIQTWWQPHGATVGALWQQ
jgi:hypothetical protein